MRALPFLALLVASSAVLAGCSGSGSKTDIETPVGPELEATDETGVIRVVALDETLRPMAAVRVNVTDNGEVQTALTGEDGFAGFEGITPGPHVVQAYRPGFKGLEQAVNVVAGVGDPDIVRMVLKASPEGQPFYVQRTFEGMMQCGAGGDLIGSANACFIANYYPCYAMRLAGQSCFGNLTTDNSYFSLPFFKEYNRIPDWVQVEMVWESTQSVSPELTLRFDIVDDAEEITWANSTSGASPLMVGVTQADAKAEGLGNTTNGALEVFSYSDTGGATVEQRITYYVHAFYGYRPPSSWRFAESGEVPGPPY